MTHMARGRLGRIGKFMALYKLACSSQHFEIGGNRTAQRWSPCPSHQVRAAPRNTTAFCSTRSPRSTDGVLV